MKLSKVANPYSIFAVSWSICLILYSLGWTDIFPKLSIKLVLFLSTLIVIFGVLGFLFNRTKPFIFSTGVLVIDYKKLVIANAVLYSLNFLYSGIPLLKGLREDNFGFPTVIVLATTLNGFTAVYCFYLLLVTKKKKFLIFIVISFLFFILAFSRGNTMMTLVTMFFVWLNVKLPTLTFKRALFLISSILLVIYLFGVAGNVRTINGLTAENPSFDSKYNSDVILAIGGASQSFKESQVPGEFFWTYLYITSPLSNLQYNIDRNSPEFTLSGVCYVFIDEILFDTVSKRIDDLLNRKRQDPDLLVEQLTVPTILAGSYNYAGWWGMALFIMFFAIFPFAYALMVLKNPLGIIGISTLCTVYFFSIFDNMLILTGLTLQIFYPILFYFTSKISLKGHNNGSTIN